MTTQQPNKINPVSLLSEKTPPPIHPCAQYMPSKKIRWVIVIIIVVAIIYGLWNPLKKLAQKGTTLLTKKELVPTELIPSPSITQQPPTLSIDKDSDGDGIPDWLETLFGTDPFVPNSESEVPRELREIITEKTTAIITTDDKLALNIYQRLLSDPQGTNINEAIQAATTKEVLDLANTLDKKAPIYGYDDIDLVDTTPQSKLNYKRQIQLIQKSLEIPESTFSSLYTSFLRGEKTITETSYQIKLTQEINKLLIMEVPLSLADQHLSLVNSLSRIVFLLTQTGSGVDESLRYAGLIAFQKNINQVSATNENIINLLKD